MKEAPLTNREMGMLGGIAEGPVRAEGELRPWIDRMIRAGLIELSLDPIHHFTIARLSAAGEKAWAQWLEQPAGRFTLELPPRHRQALQFIERRIAEHGDAPTQEELAVELGTSRGFARRTMLALDARGFIKLARGTWRGARFVQSPYEIEASP